MIFRSIRLAALYTLLCLPFQAEAKQKKNVVHQNVEIPYTPWFTGPLLTPTPINMEPGHPALEPSLTIFWTYGLYNDDWKVRSTEKAVTVNPYLDYQFATSHRTGIELQFQSFTTYSNGSSSTYLGDTNILLGYQISNDEKGSWIPDTRFLFEITLPSGNFDKLNPKHPFREITGRGAVYIGPNLAFQKLFYLENNFFIFHWAFGYFFPFRTSIHGLSLYGGTEETEGSILPGQNFDAFIAAEYSLNQRWVIGFELELIYQFASKRFRGNPGTPVNGQRSRIGLPASAEILFLPEFQYNFNSHSGLLAGGYFSIAGKNSPAIAGGFIAYLYVF